MFLIFKPGNVIHTQVLTIKPNGKLGQVEASLQTVQAKQNAETDHIMDYTWQQETEIVT